jgi:hypothetical protein
MMAGMVPTMSLLMMGRDMRAMDPFEFDAGNPNPILLELRLKFAPNRSGG